MSVNATDLPDIDMVCVLRAEAAEGTAVAAQAWGGAGHGDARGAPPTGREHRKYKTWTVKLANGGEAHLTQDLIQCDARFVPLVEAGMLT